MSSCAASTPPTWPTRSAWPPQTLDGLADSPLQLAAFMLDHGDGTGQPGLVTRVLAGTLAGGPTREDLLDNLTLCWLATTGVSAARLYPVTSGWPPRATSSVTVA
jgi:hypothetical protein